MAEVMKFEDFKNEGSEAACKVNSKCLFSFKISIYRIFINILLYDSFRLQENIANKDEITLLKMEILYFSNLMLELG